MKALTRPTHSELAIDFADCFSYALAIHLDAPLLFVGNDFGETDVKC